MTLDKEVERVMVRALHNNLDHKVGERVVIIAQKWGSSLPQETKPVFDKSVELCENLYRVYSQEGLDVALITYISSVPGSTINPTIELYEKMDSYERRVGVPEIVIAPCGYSITHTDFRVAQNKRGSRIATMSNSSLAMFTPGGP